MAQTVLNGHLNHNAAEGDNTDAFLFTSESVGEGHPGKEAGWSREVNIPGPSDTLTVTLTAVQYSLVPWSLCI